MPRPKPEIPDPDDPRYRRTCNVCGEARRWVEPACKCGGVEFSIPVTNTEETA